jgi:protein TonB
MRKYLILLFIAIVNIAFSQTVKSTKSAAGKIDTSKVDTAYIYTVAQHMPKFKGDLNKYLEDNIQYPDSEKKAKIQGTVFVNFLVEKDGSITHIKVLRSVPNGPGLSKEAVRILSNMPKWTPGMQNDQIVKVSYHLPIHFQLK